MGTCCAATTRAWARGARGLDCTSQARWASPLEPDETGRLSDLAQPLLERVHLELLFHARDRNGAQLQAALRFLEGEPALGFHRRLEGAIEGSLREASLELAERVEREAQRRCR